MASPFKVFRKHQKVMLAGLTILAMFSFVFLGVISDLLGNRQSLNPVVVRTAKYGKLRQRDIYEMRQERLRAFGVLEKMLSNTFQIDPQISRRFIENHYGTNSEEDIVYNWLKARRAEEIGMVIGNDTINDFIQNFPLMFLHYYPQFLQIYSQHKLTSYDIAAIIKQEGLTQNQFFDIMREELRASQVYTLFSISLQGMTPAQRWDYFCQLRKQASVELIPVAVEQVLAQIKDPSDGELKGLFEKFKDKLSRPDSPEPGFRVPHKIEVQYFKADAAKFSGPGAITDEEIQNSYEKNRAYFDRLDKEPDISMTPGGKGGLEKEKSGEKKETPAAGQQSPEQPKEQPGDKQQPADQPAPVEEKSPKEDAKKSSAIQRSPFRLASMAEGSEKPAAEQPVTEKPAAEKPAEDRSAIEKPAAEQPEAKNPAQNQPAQSDNPTEPKRTLSERVKENIRARIAREKINSILIKLQQAMEENGKKWRKYEAEKIHQKTAATPPRLDFEALAKKYDVIAAQSGLFSAWEAQKLDIGSSMVEGVSPFTVAAFKSMATFKPDVSIDTQGNEYLFWKINDTPESEPSFDDKEVREQVLRAWKLIQARQSARKEAEGLAETARKSNAPLKETFSDSSKIQVIVPPPFAMLTEGSVPQGSSIAPPRLSKVEDAPMAGVDFMHAVFNLDKGQIGIAMNAPQTVIYVIQLISYTPPPDAFWQIFLAEDFSKYYSAAASDLQADRRAWLEWLKTSSGLQWEMKPEQLKGEPSSDSLPEED